MATKKLFMETTEVPAERTVGEIISVLVQAGATAITQQYGDKRDLTGVSFSLQRGARHFEYVLPVRTEPVFKIINGRRQGKWGSHSQVSMAEKDQAQAKRTAWRIIYRWVQAQVAMVETGMVDTQEVFLPYLMLMDKEGNRVSAYENFVISADRQIEAPKSEVSDGG